MFFFASVVQAPTVLAEASKVRTSGKGFGPRASSPHLSTDKNTHKHSLPQTFTDLLTLPPPQSMFYCGILCQGVFTTCRGSELRVAFLLSRRLCAHTYTAHSPTVFSFPHKKIQIPQACRGFDHKGVLAHNPSQSWLWPDIR